MKKNIIILATLLMSGIAFSQVGINTDIPKATLDVVGKATDTSSLDGIIAPRLTGDQLRAKTYTTDQTGTLVYVTTADTAPAGQTVNVTSIGYFYFDGAVWQKVSNGAAAPVNIYNANGSLTGSESSRNLTLNGKELNFIGTNQRTSWRTDGVLYQENLQSSGGEGAIVITGGSSSNLYLQQFRNGPAQIQAAFNSTVLDIGTNGSTASAPLTISTSAGGGALATEKMRVTGEGNVGINTIAPTEKLDNNGITRLRNLPTDGTTNAIYTQSNGAASATQNQTFTATRTVVADANGVLGTVAGLPATPINIYNANGTLTTNRTVTTNSNSLSFTGNGNTVMISNSGTMASISANGTGRGNLTVTGGNSIVDVFADNNGVGQIIARGTGNRGLDIGSSYTTQPAHVRFLTSPGSNVPGTERMRITPTGNIGINTSLPQARLHVVKAASDLTPAIIEGCNEYADNAAATSAGLPVGGLYRTSTGVLMVRY